MGVCCAYRNPKNAQGYILNTKTPLSSYIISLSSALKNSSSHTDESKLLLHFLKSVLSRPKRLKVTIKDGLILKEDFLEIVEILNDIVRSKLAKDFLALQSRWACNYGRESLGFRVCVVESVKYVQSLYIRCPMELYSSVTITPLLYDINFSHYITHPEVQFAMFSGLYKTLSRLKPRPENLTKELLGKIMQDMDEHMSCVYSSNPPADVYDFLVMKGEESDYVMIKYGFEEYEVISAIWEYEFMYDNEFQEVRDSMVKRTHQMLKDIDMESSGNVPAGYFGLFAFSLIKLDMAI
jgi:hypothetical protein